MHESSLHPHVTFVLVRHGQARSPDGIYHDHTPLSDLGHRQARALVHAFRGDRVPVHVYVSPFVRARETAEPLCRSLAIEPRIEPRLREFTMSPGSAEDAAVRPDLAFWRPEHRGDPDGETLAEFATRVAACICDLAERHVGEKIALVTHSGTIDAVIRHCLGLGPEAPWQHDMSLPNASISEITYWPRGRVPHGAPRYAAFVRTGDTAHLAGLSSDI